MDDQAMDPCECISQNFAVRRLLSLLRQTQSYCMDTQCLDELTRPDGNSSSDYYVIMTIILAFTMIVYWLRPRSSQGINASHDQKVSGNNRGPQPPPDAPFN